MTVPACRRGSQVQNRAARSALRTEHPAPPTAAAVPRLVEVDHPGLMACIDHEPVTDDLTVDGFTPTR